ncbi:hypothetical protein HU200_021769 [Digitaria exilis]|uniref:Glycosyltransferase n=1 Tax=Digitaria exilis TaxID=1010633 RepID=A0A835KAG9_9POAL|nr:hypothetical protein HU200_021769 [Digitaria exilis]
MAGSEPDQSIHILLVSYPTQGHINPLLQFGKRLAAHRGVRCTLAVTRHVLGSGKQPQPGAVHVVAFSDGCDPRGYDEVGDALAYLARLESAGSVSLGELIRAESEMGRPVRAVHGHGVDCAAFFTHACAVTVAYAHAWAGQLTVPVVDAPPELPGLSVRLGSADLPNDLSDPGCHLVYRDLMLQQCQALEVADHVLINSFHELQAEEAEYMASRWGAKTVGPTVLLAYLDNRLTDDISYGFHLHTPMTAESKAWLDGRQAHSVVYVSFGSIVALSSDQMAEVAEGLYNSGKDFMWLDVLVHPAIGCFVTHCGWNSTMEGLCAGVPMVAMPQWGDQPMNAKYIEDVWRVGVRVRPNAEGMVHKEELERCVREVMEGETSKKFRKNAAIWSEKAGPSMAMCEVPDRTRPPKIRGPQIIF